MKRILATLLLFCAIAVVGASVLVSAPSKDAIGEVWFYPGNSTECVVWHVRKFVGDGQRTVFQSVDGSIVSVPSDKCVVIRYSTDVPTIRGNIRDTSGREDKLMLLHCDERLSDGGK